MDEHREVQARPDSREELSETRAEGALRETANSPAFEEGPTPQAASPLSPKQAIDTTDPDAGIESTEIVRPIWKLYGLQFS